MLESWGEMGQITELFREVDLGNIKIEVAIVDNSGYKVYLTAKDSDGCRLWRTALTDANGNIRVYASVSDVIKEVENTIAKSKGKVSFAKSA